MVNKNSVEQTLLDRALEPKKIRVLVIEDELISGKIIAITLNAHPHISFNLFERLDQGLAYLDKGETDVVLLDLTLPDSSGLDTLSRLHSHSPSVAVVIHSGADDDGTALKALQMGAQDYLVKGKLSRELLPKMLSYAVERKASEEKLKAITTELKESYSELEEVISLSNQRLVEAEFTSIQMEQIFNAGSDGMWVIDLKFNVLRVNETFTNLLGQSSENIVGRKCYDILGCSICQRKECPLVSIEHTTGEIEKDVEYAGPDGKVISLVLSAKVLQDPSGEIVGIVENVKDITWRKQAERELQNANQILERLSAIDGLTQINNRRAFTDSLNREWKRMIREKKNLSLVMCDVDFFKQYNDTYGHLLGDDCLKKIAEALTESVFRPSDIVARYGGEEFVILLPNTDPEGARQVAERTRTIVEAFRIPHSGSSVSEFVSISLGVATMFPDAELEPEILIKRADEALYEAKGSGRNRYCVFDDAA